MPLKLKPIVPRKGFLGDVNALERAIDKALDDTADFTKEQFDKTAQTWNDKPSFVVSKTKAGRSVYTRHRVWNMLNKGTRAHPIRPKRAKVLRFSVGGKSKTRPRIIGSTRGSTGTTPVVARRVMHPGTEPREWDIVIAPKAQDELGRNMRRNLKSLFK